MSESICDYLLRLSSVLHFFKMYEDAKRISRLSVWLRGRDVPEDI